MSKFPNPKGGGTYVKASEDSEPIYVHGTDRKQTHEEAAAAKKAIAAAEKSAKDRAKAEEPAEES